MHRRFATNPIQIRLNTSTNEYPIALAFKLEDVQSYTELTQLYDQYKISSVNVSIMWSPALQPDESAVIIPPSLYTMWKIDRDDSLPNSIAELKQCSRSKLMLMKPQKRYKILVRPAILTQLYESAVSTGYGIKFNQKIDAGDPNVPHYGLKFCAVKPQLANGSYAHDMGTITVELQYNLTMYNTR